MRPFRLTHLEKKNHEKFNWKNTIQKMSNFINLFVFLVAYKNGQQSDFLGIIGPYGKHSIPVSTAKPENHSFKAIACFAIIIMMRCQVDLNKKKNKTKNNQIGCDEFPLNMPLKTRSIRIL